MGVVIDDENFFVFGDSSSGLGYGVFLDSCIKDGKWWYYRLGV